MNWLRTTSAIDELIDKATSENLPAGSEDLALNLEICDQIRSKQVSPKDAAKALKRRISHKNPNVQLLALGLTDVCVKNGGQHFLVEVASREFVDNLMSILKAPAGCNLEVKNRILTLMQTWGRLFRGKQGLGYVCDSYMILQHEGYDFPPVDNVGAALVETAAPPDWTDSDVCTRCRTTFTLTNRKHHCRACGSTFCGQCSSKSMSLPHLGVNQEVRVCDGCWIKKKMGGKGTAVHDSDGLGGAAEFVPSVSSSTQPIATSTSAPGSNAGNEDDDLLKAIELSLKEANSQPGYSAPSTNRKEQEPIKKTIAPPVEEDDADLLAAIEASLRETSLNASSTAVQPDQRQSAYATYTYATKPEVTADSSHALTETEIDNIEMFSSLVDRIQMLNGDVAGNREVQALYEQISKLQSKVSISLEEAEKRQQEVIYFNEQIDQAVRMYDHLLQERLNSTYQRRMNTNSYAYPGLQQPSAGLNTGYDVASPQNAHMYPHLTGSDPRFNQYAPGAPYDQHTPQSFAPQAPPSQTAYQYQPPQSSATAPFAGSLPSAGPSGSEFATAPFAPTPFAPAPTPAQSIISDPYYAASPPAPSAAVSPPGTQASGHFQQHLGGYPTIAAQLQPGDVDPSGQGQGAYAPYGGQQQQQQQHVQAYAPPVPLAAAAPVVPVEEKPLIEL